MVTVAAPSVDRLMDGSVREAVEYRFTQMAAFVSKMDVNFGAHIDLEENSSESFAVEELG